MTDINFILLFCFGLLMLFIIFQASIKRIGMIQYPFLLTLVMLGWVFPQLIGIGFNDLVPQEAITKTIVYASLCLIAAVSGYSYAQSPFKISRWRYSPQKLDISAAILMSLGLYFYIQVVNLAEEATRLYGGFWTGEITIYVFLSNLFKFGFIIAAASNLKRPSILNRVLIGFGFLVFAQRVVFLGRREDAVEVFLITIIFLWLKFGWIPKRWIMITIVFVAVLFVNTISTYRNIMIVDANSGRASSTISEISRVDFYSIFIKNAASSEGNFEVTNAAFIIEASDRTLSFDGGLSFWNTFVLSYVPGQIIGPQNKRDLLLEFDDVALNEFHHIPWPGSTRTGLADSFRSFWYLGAAIFFAIGYIMKRWFIGAKLGSTTCVIMVMYLASESLLALTHTTHSFFLAMVLFVFFLLPALVYSRKSLNVRRQRRIGGD
jgi:hypothetical protein